MGKRCWVISSTRDAVAYGTPIAPTASIAPSQPELVGVVAYNKRATAAAAANENRVVLLTGKLIAPEACPVAV